MQNKRASILKKNKRGDVPVTVLVLGVLAVCTLAMLSFISADRNSQKSFIGVEILEQAHIQVEMNGLQKFYEEETKTAFKPRIGGKWIQKKVIFSVEYIPNP
jgi:hypothetical protein